MVKEQRPYQLKFHDLQEPLQVYLCEAGTRMFLGQGGWVTAQKDFHADKMTGEKVKGLPAYRTRESVPVASEGPIWTVRSEVWFGAKQNTIRKAK